MAPPVLPARAGCARWRPRCNRGRRARRSSAAIRPCQRRRSIAIARRVKHMGQRDGEDLLHLARLGDRGESAADQAENGGHRQSRSPFRAPASVPRICDAGRGKADLLPRLAQGGGFGAGVGRRRPCRRERRSGRGGASDARSAWSGSAARLRAAARPAPERPPGARAVRRRAGCRGSGRSPTTRPAGRASARSGVHLDPASPGAFCRLEAQRLGVELVMRAAELAIGGDDTFGRGHCAMSFWPIDRHRAAHLVRRTGTAEAHRLGIEDARAFLVEQPHQKIGRRDRGADQSPALRPCRAAGWRGSSFRPRPRPGCRHGSAGRPRRCPVRPQQPPTAGHVLQHHAARPPVRGAAGLCACAEGQRQSGSGICSDWAK